MTTRSRITSVKGLFDAPLLPRRGKIRGGAKKKSKTGAEYPVETQHFVCPVEVQQVYGNEPTELDIMFPVEDAEARCMPHAYKLWRANGLICKGDGEVALRRAGDLIFKDTRGQTVDDATARRVDDDEAVPSDPNALVEIQCPCPLLERGECSLSANLMVLLPRVSLGGVYQIDTGSRANIGRILSAIAFTREMVGRVAMVPMKLYRRPEQMTYTDPKTGAQKKSTHYLLHLEPNIPNADDLQQLRRDKDLILMRTSRLSLPEPVEDGPDPAPGAVVLEVDDEDGPDDDLAFLDAVPMAADDPLRAATSFELKMLADAAEKVGALVVDPNNPKKRAIGVSDSAAKACGLPSAGTYKPTVMTVGQIIKLTKHFKSLDGGGLGI